jgi:glycosyltransferase involved in cell wall biosynthesis
MTYPLKLAVAFINFGPYHMARLEALGRLAQERGLEIWGLELCAGEADYPWQVNSPPSHFRRCTLFSDRRLSELNPLVQVRRMFRCLETLRPQALAVAGYSLPAMWAALTWAKLRRHPVVVMGDSTAADLPRVRWRETLKRWLVSRFDAALVGGAPQRAYFHALGIPADRIFLGYDVVDNDHYFHNAQNAQAVRGQAENRRAALGLPASYFLSVSRFVPKKNLPGLLTAYAHYRELSAAPWDLVLCGAGPEEARLRNLARFLPGVHFTGFRQADALPAYYGLAKCFILPSSMNEPWGLVVNEAMAAGLPVLVSRVCGSSCDLVQEGVNGYTFDPRDPEALARLMASMSSGRLDLKAMGAASLSIIARWTPQVFAENLLKAVDAATHL